MRARKAHFTAATRTVCLLASVALALPAAAADPVASAVRSLVSGGVPRRTLGTPIHARLEVARWYRARDFEPVWTGERGHARAVALLAAVYGAEHEGLDPRAYHLTVVDAAVAGGPGGASAPRDLVLTDALLLLASHFDQGRVRPRSRRPDWTALRGGPERRARLLAALEDDDLGAALDRLLPQDPGYARLRAARLALSALRAAGGWPGLDPSGEPLGEGDMGPEVETVRRRLFALGDIAGPVEDDVFDAELAAAVRRFQGRHGLEVTGALDTLTRRHLARSLERRLDQIDANLERARWRPRALPTPSLEVNVPSFTLTWHDPEPVRTQRIVVGRRDRPTPLGIGLVTRVILRPHWEVPHLIATEDLLPREQESPGYLTRHHYRVLEGDIEVDPASVDWSAVTKETFAWTLRRRPGRSNPLGRAMLVVSPPLDATLHGTSTPWVFQRASRACSSGCIRVDDEIALARFVLERDRRWGPRVERLLAGRRERVLDLARSMPVRITYRTAWVEPDGTLQLRPDVYRRDRRVVRALRVRPPGAPPSLYAAAP